MAQRYVEVVRGCYEALNRGDMDAAFGTYYHESVVFLEPEGSPWAGTYHGHDGMREFLGRVVADVENLQLGPEEFLDAGDDRVVVLSHVLGLVKSTGESLDLPYCGVVRVRDDKIVEFRTYRDTALAQRMLNG